MYQKMNKLALVRRANDCESNASAIRSACIQCHIKSTASMLLLMSVNGARFGGEARRVRGGGGGQISTFDSGVK